MENQKLLKNLNSKGRLLALLLTVTTGLLYCSSAWAETCQGGIQYENQSGISFSVRGTTIYRSNSLGGNGTAFGDVTTLKINNLKLVAYQTGEYNDWSYKTFELCDDTHFGYKIKSPANVNGTVVNEGSQKLGCSWGEFITDYDNHTKYRYPTWSWNTEFDAISGISAAGNYRAEFWFTLKGKGCNSNDCNAFTQYGKATEEAGDAGNFYVTFTIQGVTMSSTSHNFEGVAVGNSKDQSFTATLYGTSNSIKSVSSSNTTDFEVSISGTTVTVTFHPQTPGDKSATITVTPTNGRVATIEVTGTGNNTPTVLIAGKESVDAPNVTLNGYIKYTGCETVTEYGFVYGTSSEVTISATKVVASPDPIGTVVAGTDFTKTFEVAESGTYYYKAYMITSGGNYLSDETRQFTVDIACDIITTVNATFEDGSTTASATFTDGSASIGVMSTNHSQYFQWVCESKPDGANATFEPQGKRTSTITVNMVGQYTIKLQGKCNESDNWIDSEILTLNVCAPAEFTQLYLDKHINNVLCEGEEATATCITKENYTYALYGPDGEQIGVPLPGTGATQTWRHVEGAGEFTMRTSPTGMDYCVAIVSSATQSYNTPTLEITADTDLENVTNYQPVILSKKNVTSDTYVDTNPTWEITTGSDKGYLLNEHNRLAYDSRAREKVVFKGGAADETEITVKASAYKTVAVEDEGGNYTKQCPTTVEVDLTVKPAIDDCD